MQWGGKTPDSSQQKRRDGAYLAGEQVQLVRRAALQQAARPGAELPVAAKEVAVLILPGHGLLLGLRHQPPRLPLLQGQGGALQRSGSVMWIGHYEFYR